MSARAWRWAAAVWAVLLAGCASGDSSRMVGAATAPLNDFNLMQTEIPRVLLEAQKQPYRGPTGGTCPVLAAEVAELDAALGPDLDTPATEANPGLLERGGTEVTNSAIGALRRTTESVVPFRSWIRQLTGAERYSRKVAAAITAGGARRAFLKGLRAAGHCPAPLPPAATAVR